MKRARSSKKSNTPEDDKQWSMIPMDLLAPIAAQMIGWSVSDLMRFSLVCTTARNALPFALEHWVTALQIQFGALLTATDTILLTLCLKRHDVETPQLTKLINAYVKERSDFLQQGEIGFTPKHIDFLTNIFELQKLALQEEYWLLSKVDVPKEHIRKGSKVRQTVSYDGKTKLHHVFYYDNKTGQALPLRKLPGLRTMELPPQHAKVKRLLTNEIQSHVKGTHEALERVANIGLRRIGVNKPLVRELCYKLLRDKGTLVTHKPHRKSLLCNALVGTRYVFDSSDDRMVALHGQLYTCHYRPATASTTDNINEKELDKTKQFIVAFQVTNRARFVAIQRNLGITVYKDCSTLPQPVVRPSRNAWSLEESDESFGSDDSSNDDDDEPTHGDDIKVEQEFFDDV